MFFLMVVLASFLGCCLYGNRVALGHFFISREFVGLLFWLFKAALMCGVLWLVFVILGFAEGWLK